MISFAMLFPGQGAQYIGMLSSYFCKKNNFLKKTFDEASDCIHYDLIKLIQDGPKTKLNESKYTQAVILTASVSIYRLWRKKHGQLPLFMSGHSLGEYSALVCSNAIKFSDALKIVFFRGQIMQDIIKNRSVLMQAIIGLNKEQVKYACLMASNKKKIVSLACINSTDQIVISGDKSSVYKASYICKKLGAKHILNLHSNISAHCALLKPLSQKLEQLLEKITIKQPTIPVINNVDVKCENTSKNIKRALIRQIYSTVRWKEIIEFIQLKKIFFMIEIGPNKILTNLNKKNKNIISFHTNDLKNFSTLFKIIN